MYTVNDNDLIVDTAFPIVDMDSTKDTLAQSRPHQTRQPQNICRIMTNVTSHCSTQEPTLAGSHERRIRSSSFKQNIVFGSTTYYHECLFKMGVSSETKVRHLSR